MPRPNDICAYTARGVRCGLPFSVHKGGHAFVAAAPPEPAPLPWDERITVLSIHPDAATRDDVARLASELMQVRADLAAPRAVSLEEIETILAPMMWYAKIHYVRGVRYPEGTHEEISDKYERLLNRLRDATAAGSSDACSRCFGERSLGDCQVTQRLHAESLSDAIKIVEAKRDEWQRKSDTAHNATERDWNQRVTAANEILTALKEVK